jgi:formamidopyrimidine-DNA glycosylase
MPELPDITVYIEALARRIAGETLDSIRLSSPFVLRTVSPSPEEISGSRVDAVSRLGKRIVLELEKDAFIVIHLMIAGRLQWAPAPAPEKKGGKNALAAFRFSSGILRLTEAGSRRRASIHILGDRQALHALDPGGLDPLSMTDVEFAERLTSERRTLKRGLTDPRLFSGIGNAYSDEILFRARLSPTQITTNLDEREIRVLAAATRNVLLEWIDRLRLDTGEGFPSKVTAFRPEMAVHGKYGQPCPDCGSAIQRIVHAENETNYCARCQTGGKLLADRALSRLLREDWPRSIDELG